MYGQSSTDSISVSGFLSLPTNNGRVKTVLNIEWWSGKTITHKLIRKIYALGNGLLHCPTPEASQYDVIFLSTYDIYALICEHHTDLLSVIHWTDYNECEPPPIGCGPAQGMCKNTIGSYKCFCHPGLQKVKGRGCIGKILFMETNMVYYILSYMKTSGLQERTLCFPFPKSSSI